MKGVEVRRVEGRKSEKEEKGGRRRAYGGRSIEERNNVQRDDVHGKVQQSSSASISHEPTNMEQNINGKRKEERTWRRRTRDNIVLFAQDHLVLWGCLIGSLSYINCDEYIKIIS